jgi:hypothetical protein
VMVARTSLSWPPPSAEGLAADRTVTRNNYCREKNSKRTLHLVLHSIVVSDCKYLLLENETRGVSTYLSVPVPRFCRHRAGCRGDHCAVAKLRRSESRAQPLLHPFDLGDARLFGKQVLKTTRSCVKGSAFRLAKRGSLGIKQN